MTGGTEAGYRKVLAQFYKDAAERLPLFAEVPATTEDSDTDQVPEGKFSKGKPDWKVTEQLSAFTAQAHAIKSAAGTIGAAEVPEEAAKLEAAGKAGDMQTIGAILPLFREHLTQLIEAIGKNLERKSEELRVKSEELGVRSGEEGSSAIPCSSLDIHSPLLNLKESLATKNMKEIDRLFEEIERLPLDAETREAINTISDKVLMGEYEETIEIVNALLAAKR
jgi:HPt (histidine-containing phosphotransfer) domain-containing protein